MMNKWKPQQVALAQALAAGIYIFAVAWVMNNAGRWFGSDKPDNFLAPAGLLLLLVLSASVMSCLIFGRAIMMYLDGAKKEAVRLVLMTIGWLLLLTVIVFATLVWIR